MTAEIAIINRQGIAIAADSAVTIGRERVWKNSNKLFSLGPDNDMAVMIYGAAELSGFPWELIVKLFRSNNGGNKFPTVENCTKSFISFIRQKKFLPDARNRAVNLSIFLEIIEDICKSVHKREKISEYRKDFIVVCKAKCAEFEGNAEIEGASLFSKFKAEYGEICRKFARDVSDYIITNAMANELVKAVYAFYAHAISSNYFTGLIIIGYGEDELFPCFTESHIDGRFGEFTRLWRIGSQDCNADDAQKVLIKPFAQTDIFYLFMEGIEPAHMVFISRYLDEILNSKSDTLIKDFVHKPDEALVEKARQKRANRVILEEFTREFQDFRRKTVVLKILDVVAALPKEDMAEMAVALVEITSLRRKVDSKVESVGGPVDVAVISKGDGLVWLKRKEYFDLAKNKDFLYRKFGVRSKSNV